MRHLLLAVLLMLALGRGVLSEDQADPPYAGTVWIDPDVITPSDPTALVSVTDAGRGVRTMFDRRVEAWIEINAYLFMALFDDGLTVEIQVNPEFGRAEAGKYGRSMSSHPRRRFPPSPLHARPYYESRFSVPLHRLDPRAGLGTYRTLRAPINRDFGK